MNMTKMVITKKTRMKSWKKSDIFMGVSKCGVTVSKDAMKAIDNRTNLDVLVDHKNKKLALVGAPHARHGNAHTVFYKYANYTRLTGAPFARVIRELTGVTDKSFRLTGSVGEDGKSLVFDMSTAFVK